MYDELYQGTQEENDDSAAMWCYPDEHDMIDVDDIESPYYMCKKCGYSANVYVVNSFESEVLQA